MNNVQPRQPKEPITEELVQRICNQLKAEKKPVTNRAVRDALGRGSYLTINPFVNAWQTRDAEQYRISLTAIPEAVEDAAVLAAQKIWQAASELASEQLKEMGRRIHEMEASHARLRQEDMEEIGRLEAERDALGQEKQELLERLTEETRAMNEARAGLMEVTQKLTVALMREHELDRQKGLLEKELKAARDDAARVSKDGLKVEAFLEIERSDREKAEAEFSTARTVLRDLHEQVSSLQKALAVEQQKARGVSEGNLQLKEQLDRERESSKNMIERQQADHDALRRVLNEVLGARKETPEKPKSAESAVDHFGN